LGSPRGFLYDRFPADLATKRRSIMKIYDSKIAPNPRRVRIFLAEKGIQVPYEQVDLMKKENLTPGFLAMNPMGRVPVLELDDGTHIAESVAICRYFEELQPSPPLMGTDPKSKAIIEMWQRRMELELFLNVSGAFRHSFPPFADRVKQIPAWAEQCREAAVKNVAWLDEVLADRPFIAGNSYTIADITAFCAVDFAKMIQIKIDAEKQKNLARWYSALAARPSAKA
jgi:glutathione S-transferase